MEIAKYRTHKRFLEHCIRIAKNDPAFVQVPYDFRDTENAYMTFGMPDSTAAVDLARIEAEFWVGALEMNSVLQEVLLNVSSIDLAEHGAEKVHRFLSRNPDLKCLRLWLSSETHNQTCQVLFHGINFPSLQRLQICLNLPAYTCQQECRRSSISLHSIAGVMARSHYLSELVVENSVLGQAEMRGIASGIAESRSIKHISISQTRCFDRNFIIADDDEMNIPQCPGEAFANALRFNPALESIKFYRSPITSENLNQFAMTLSQKDIRIKSLSFTEIDLSGRCAEVLGNYLSNNPILKELTLTSAGLKSPDGACIARGLVTNQHLKRLCLRKNRLSEGLIFSSFSRWRRLLSRNGTLEELDLAFNDLREGLVACLFDGLIANSSVRALNVSNEVELVEAKHLAMMGITKKSTIRPQVARVVACALRQGNTLVTLNLSMYHLGDQGIEALAEGLNTNTSLKQLKLRSVGLGNEGLVFFATALVGSSRLEVLDISNNMDIDSDGISAFGRRLPAMTWLKELWFHGGDNEAKARMRSFAPLLVPGLRGNFTMVQMSYGKDFPLTRFYLDLNRFGRHYVYNDVIPLALWGDVLARLSRTEHVHLLYFFVRNKADMLCATTPSSCRKRKHDELDMAFDL